MVELYLCSKSDCGSSFSIDCSYFSESIVQPWVKNCCHVLAVAPRHYVDILDELQKRVYRTAVLPLAAFLEPLNHCGNLVSLSLFYTYYFKRFTHCSNSLNPFLSPLLDVSDTKMSMLTVCFLTQGVSANLFQQNVFF